MPARRRWATALLFAAGLVAAGSGSVEAQTPGVEASTTLADVTEAVRLSREATRLYEQGRFGEALPLAARALTTLEGAVGSDNPGVAVLLTSLAVIHKAMGENARAEPLLVRAIAIGDKTFGPDDARMAAPLNSLARLYFYEGDYPRAEPLFVRALAIQENAVGPNHPDVAIALVNLGGLYLTRGDSTRAEPLFSRALAIQEKALGPEAPEVATTLNDFAGVYQVRGDYARAEPLFLRALAVREKTLGANDPAVATVLDNLAGIYQSKGDFARAEPLFVRALAVQEKALGPDQPGVATALNDLATLYADRGDSARAEPLLVRALAIREKALGADHAAVATVLNNLALLFLDRGDRARAEPLLARALAIREKSLGPDHPTVAGDLGNLAALYEANGDLGRAVGLQARSNEIRERQLALVLAVGGEDQKLATMATLARETDATVSLHVRLAPTDPEAAKLAVTTVLRRKGRVLDAMTDSMTALRRRLGPGDQALLDELASVQSQRATVTLRGPGAGSSAQHLAALAEFAARALKLEAAISERSAVFRAQREPVTLERVRSAIPEQAALVEIVVYEPFDPAARSAAKAWGERRYVAYVLHRAGEITWADLGEARPIDALADELRAALSGGDQRDATAPGRALDERVMRPIRKLLGGSRRVLLSPDGNLNVVPFGAMVDEDNRYLLSSYSFTYLTTGRDLLRLGRVPSGAVAAQAPPLVVANPDFGSFDAEQLAPDTRGGPRRAADLSRAHFTPLPGTAAEAADVGALLDGAKVFTGVDATEGRVKRAHGPSILHLATHGFFLADQPIPTRDTRGLTLDPWEPPRAGAPGIDNPLLRSGLALASANTRRSGDDDGILTALEASALDLFGTRLVVLSACETGLGQVSNGDGVYGLRRALEIAGAESQIMSLWKVDDDATRQLMAGYYRKLRVGGGRTEALREVELEMASSPRWKHPYYWASFIPSGDWRSLAGADVEVAVHDGGFAKVPPGSRGCGCEVGGREGGNGSGLALGALALAALVASSARRR